MLILIIDDDSLVAESLSRLLLRLGHQVLLADGPEAAIARLASTHVDLVLLDWMMPGGGGDRVIRYLAGRTGVPHPRLVLTTGYPLGEIAGLPPHVEVLHKPFSLAALQRILTGS